MVKDTFSYPQERMSMRSREDEVRATVSKEEAIRRIEKLGGVYDSTNIGFDVYDQLLVCEAIAESTPIIPPPIKDVTTTVENVVAYEDGNDGYKQQVSFELTANKLEAISKLKKLTYRTPPPEIASLLETIFEGCDTYTGWWLSVAQQWNPRAISRVLVQLTKLHSGGWRTFKNPGAYFTSLIKHRKKRRRPRISMMAVNNTKQNI